MPSARFAFLTLLLGGCSLPAGAYGGPSRSEPLWGAAPPSWTPPEPGSAAEPRAQESSGRRWRAGEAMTQGYFGAAFADVNRKGGGTAEIDSKEVTLPAAGGGAQWKLGGDAIDLGLEALLGVQWESNIAAFAVGGGGAQIAVNMDLFAFELFGGPFANLFLGDLARVYVGAGPLFQWAFYDQESAVPAADGDGSGFGVGYYARTGIEFGLGPSTMLGAGIRWSQSSLNLGGSLGDLDLDGILLMFTVTQRF